MSYNLITILGPTAVGKTKLGVQLANKFNGEIISADSRQVYNGMDIGTGKDKSEYLINGKEIKYHLIDIMEPKDEFNLFEFIKNFNLAFSEITKKKKTPIMVGGSGLYLNSVLQNYKLNKADFNENLIADLKKKPTEKLVEELKALSPKLHNTTDLIDKDRIVNAIIVERSKKIKNKLSSDVKSFNIGIRINRETLKEKINLRLKQRLNCGMIDEVKSLLDSGLSFERLKLFGLEYKFISMHLVGELNYNDMFQKLNSAINNFAKRQMTWFRKMEKEGCIINWIDSGDLETANELIARNYYNG